ISSRFAMARDCRSLHGSPPRLAVSLRCRRFDRLGPDRLELTPRRKVDCRRDALGRRRPPPVGFFPGATMETPVDGYGLSAGEKPITHLRLCVPGRHPEEARLALRSRAVDGPQE